jgi:signal transduction histidine kinase
MLANLPIRSKLIAILVVPLLVLTVLTLVQMRSVVTRSAKADRVDRLTGLAVEQSTFVHELQRERGLSAGYVASGAGHDAMIAQRARVTQELRDFRAEAAALDLDGFAPQLRQQLQAARTQLDELGNQRAAIEAREATSADEVFEYFTTTIGHLPDVEAAVAAETDDSEVLRAASAFTALARAKEAASKERDLVHAVLPAGRFTPQQYEQLVTAIGSGDTWVSRFNSSASGPQRTFYQRTVAGPDIEQARRLRNALLRSSAGGQISLDPSGGGAAASGAGAKELAGSDAKNWYSVMTAKVDLLRQVESKLAADLAAASAASRSSGSRQAAVSVAVLLVALVLTVGISLLIARSMVGPLRRLRRTAIDVAERRLPGVVDRLQGGERVDVAAETAPVGITSRDEIGQVAEAFNSVHRVAVQVATEQAALRKSVGDTFLNLARRSQALIHRQLKLIDRLERKTTDPDELGELFHLDHLATRMRRNAEDLIVLSGAKPARRWGKPVLLNDVIRGAIAEVEDYTRVDLLPASGVALVGQAVGDVIHLLAELIENATSFSPPHTKVHVAGQQAATGFVVEIEDRGIGMSDDELAEANERLASPPTMDLALSQRLGLFVVGRLAEHHGIKVQLRHSWYGGVAALVWLPDALIAHPQVGPEAIGARRRAELAAPDRGQPAAGPAAGDLPIFEAARSDWFAAADGGELVYMPLRRRGAEDVVNGRIQAGAASGSEAGPARPGGPPGEAGGRDPRPLDNARFQRGEAPSTPGEAEGPDPADAPATRDPASGPPAAGPPAARPAPRPGRRAWEMPAPAPQVADAPAPHADADAHPPASHPGVSASAGPAVAAGPPSPAGTASRPAVADPAAPGPGGPAAPGPGGPAAPAGEPVRPATAGGTAPAGAGGAATPAGEPARPVAAGGPAPRVGGGPAALGDDGGPAPAAAEEWAGAATGPRRREAVDPNGQWPADGPAPRPPNAPQATTDTGLPRRIPQASLAPGIVATGPATNPGAGGGGTLPRRTPDDVRALLSNYRSSVERGRHEASTDAFRSARDDDDEQAE